MITLLGGFRRLGPLRLTGLAATAAVTTALAASPSTRRTAASAAVAAARAAQFLFIGATRFTAAPHRAAQRQWAADGSAAALDGAALGGQHYIVTGANAGLGLEVARGLAARGGTVHLLCRSEERGRAAVDALVADGAAGGAAEADLRRRLCLHVVDVSSLAAVDAFASAYVADGRPLHGLVNNAGVLCNVVTPSADGLEAAFATNTLGTYALTERLLPVLAATPGPSVVVVVSSAGMLTADLVVGGLAAAATVVDAPPPAAAPAAAASAGAPAALVAGQPMDGAAAYAVTKRQQVALVEAWAAAAPPGVAVHACHPGWADTGGLRASMPDFHRTFASRLRTPAQGADTALWLTVVGTAVVAGGGAAPGGVAAPAAAPGGGGGDSAARAAPPDPWAAARRRLGSGGFWFDRAPAAKHLWVGGTRYDAAAPAALAAELRAIVEAGGKGH